jgi:hypothetical protein
LLAAAVCMLVPSAAFADPTAEQALTLQQQLRGWIEQTLGSGIKIPDGLFQVAADADHYRISMRLSALPVFANAQGGDLAVSAQALPAGRWLLYDYRFASPLKFRMDLPPMGAESTASAGPLDFSISYGKLNGDAILDPGFATPSILTTRVEGYDTDAVNSKMRQKMHVDTLGGHAALIPSPGGRIDVIDEGAAENFSVVTKSADPQQSVAVFLGRVEVGGQIIGLDRDRVAPLIQNLVQVSTNALASMPPHDGQTTSPGNEPAAEKPKPDRQSLRDLYLKLRGMVAGGEFRETLDDVRAEMGGHVVDLSRFSLGVGVGTQNGTLKGHLMFALDGLAAPDIPAPVRGYVPHRVLVRPSFSGIDLADLDALIMAVTAPGPEPSMEQPEIARRIQAMFAHGGITAGLDALEVDLGSTRLSATGKVTALSPDHFKGEADVAAIGFDALVAQVQTSPEWGKVAPFLQLLGKLGRPDGERIVWTITADNADVKVNGLDIPALIAASKGR